MRGHYTQHPKNNEDRSMNRKSPPPEIEIDFARLYDLHPEYEARRRTNSPEKAQIELEIAHFKLPYLLRQLNSYSPHSILEIGCATGELIGNFPIKKDGFRMGIDISECNIKIAQQRFPKVSFESGDFRQMDLPKFDLVILSDILEHVPEDKLFLAQAAKLAPRVLVNLPLECNWLNRYRNYGPTDASGHLRSYTLNQGLALFQEAGLKLQSWERVWIHETEAEKLRRRLRIQQQGKAFAGGPIGSLIRQSIFTLASILPPLGRHLFASNLFALAKNLENP